MVKEMVELGVRTIRIGVLCGLVAVSARDAPTKHGNHASRSVVIHYFYFDDMPSYPYTLSEIRQSQGWTHRLSRKEATQLYSFLKRHGVAAAYPTNTTRLIIDSSVVGPRVLVGRRGGVKMGSKEYRLTAADFAAVKAFIYARVPPPKFP